MKKLNRFFKIVCEYIVGCIGVIFWTSLGLVFWAMLERFNTFLDRFL